MLENDDWKLAIEDARARHTAVVSLIYTADAQALGLLRLVVTISIATSAGAVSTFTGSPIASLPLGVALSSATLAFVYSAAQCLMATGLRPSAINLPGRGAEFWLWAADVKDAREHVFLEYLRSLALKHELNNSLNARQAHALRRAKIATIAAPPIAIVLGLVTGPVIVLVQRTFPGFGTWLF